MVDFQEIEMPKKSKNSLLSQERRAAIRQILLVDCEMPDDVLHSAMFKDGFQALPEGSPPWKAERAYISSVRSSLRYELKRAKSKTAGKKPMKLGRPRKSKQVAKAVQPERLVLQVTLPPVGALIQVNGADGRRRANLIVTDTGFRHLPPNSKTDGEDVAELPWAFLGAVSGLGAHLVGTVEPLSQSVKLTRG
jgi:hypothetical protein